MRVSNVKCPKCGSEDTSQGTVGYKFMCWDCDNTFLVTKEELYQQRLDNVLKKFKRVMIKAESGNVTYLYHNPSEWIGIGYYETEKCFKILTNIPIQPIISLETVESLLEDLSNETT